MEYHKGVHVLKMLLAGFCRQARPSVNIVKHWHVSSVNNWCHFSAAAAAAVGEVWGGVPARFVRKLTHDEKDMLKEEAVDINRAAWAVRKGEAAVGTVCWADTWTCRFCTMLATRVVMCW